MVELLKDLYVWICRRLIDNYRATIKNRETGMSSLVYDQHKLSQISSSLSFIISTASKLLSTD